MYYIRSFHISQFILNFGPHSLYISIGSVIVAEKVLYFYSMISNTKTIAYRMNSYHPHIISLALFRKLLLLGIVLRFTILDLQCYFFLKKP